MTEENKNVTIETTENAATEAAAETKPSVNSPADIATKAVAAANVPDDVAALLRKYGVTDLAAAAVVLDELGVDCAADMTSLSGDELTRLGLKPVKARNLLKELEGAQVKQNAAPMEAAEPVVRAVSLLPAVPSNEAWLEGLKTDGVLKADRSAVVSAARAVVADAINIKNVLKELCDMIKRRSRSIGESVPQLYWDLKNARTKMSPEYRAVFAAIGGVSAVGEEDRKQLIKSVREDLLVAAGSAISVLYGWEDQYNKLAMNPRNMMAMMGGRNAMVAAVPDMGVLRDAGDNVRNAANRALAGTGPAAAAALAVDYEQVKKHLSNPELPAKCGCETREQLFNQLGINVSGSLIRTENALVQILLAFIDSDKVPASKEADYYDELYQVALQLDLRALGMDVTPPVVDNSGSVHAFRAVTGAQVE